VIEPRIFLYALATVLCIALVVFVVLYGEGDVKWLPATYFFGMTVFLIVTILRTLSKKQ